MAINFKEFPEEYAELLKEVYRATACSDNEIEESWSTQFWMFSMAANDKASWEFGDMVENIGLISENPKFWLESNWSQSTNINYMIKIPDKAKLWGVKFLKQFIKEIRLIICEKQKEKNAIDDYKHYPKAIIVAVSSSLMTALSITNPMVLGLATLILLVLSTATKNAFCNMTDEDVIKSVEKSSNIS